MAITAKEKVTTATDEGNGGPAMEVRLCGGHMSFSHDHGGPAKEILWWSEEKRVERWKRTFERWEIRISKGKNNNNKWIKMII